MALWKEPNATAAAPVGAPPAERAPLAAVSADTSRRPRERVEAKESVIASGLNIEGKIDGTGHVRVAGRFKGDVQVDGDLTIESGATLTGQVSAHVVVVAGELQGNIVSARRVELAETGVITGDVKAGALTVAAGSRMRGQVEFGWEEKAGRSNGA